MYYFSFQHTAFGGVQVIVFGDFMQLPPVPNVDHGDFGRATFHSEAWNAIKHVHILQEVKRQTDSDQGTHASLKSSNMFTAYRL
jgi:hypothetical protein